MVHNYIVRKKKKIKKKKENKKCTTDQFIAYVRLHKKGEKSKVYRRKIKSITSNRVLVKTVQI